MDQFNVQDLCYDNIKCHDWQCQKKHPRCFAGICIQGLNDDEECTNQNCQLFHVSTDTLFNEIQINGYYRYNMCKKKNCEINTCRYLHPTWIQDYCVDFFQSKCKQNCNNHLRWAQMKNQIYEKYNIQNLNPEVICKKDKCKCQNHLANIDDFCIDYFQGICPLIECSKKHVFWEELKSNRKLQFEEPKLKPCNKRNYRFQQETIENNSQIKVMIDEQELKRMHKALQQQNIIDIIFIMDCTKTMDRWIQQCHSQMANIIEKFQNQNNKYITRIGFVGYRDIVVKKKQSVIQFDRKSVISSEESDQVNQNDFEIVDKNHVVFHDLTDKIASIIEFIKQQKACGGGDEAEDVVAGIEKASQLNISKHQDTVLITFLFADSPCHGKQYHDIDDDDFMDKVPLGTLENVMRRYRKIKNNNFFFCSRISQKTDKMFSIMKSVFPEVSITDHITPEDFPNLISFSLQDSFSKISKSQILKPIEIKAQSIKSKYIEYDCKTTEDKKQFWGNFVQICQQQERINETIIKINQNPEKILENEDGVNSYIFKVFDVINNQNLVAKIPKKIVQEYQKKEQILKQNNSNERVQLSEELIQEAKKFAQSRFISQTIAKQLAKIYREKIQNLNGAPPIFYVSPMIYSLSSPFYGLDYIYAESYINLPNIQWKKYSNNLQYISPDHYYYSSFSHFTYEETGIVNLISIQLFITNKSNSVPLQIVFDCRFIRQIKYIQRSINLESRKLQLKFKLRYHQNMLEQILILKYYNTTNLNQEGIANFFYNAHDKCSFICQELQLINTAAITQFDETKWEFNETQELSIICETCDEYQQIQLIDFFNNCHKKCQQCKELEQAIHEIQCCCCFENFKTPINQQLRIGTVLGKCESCKVSCRQQNLICFYCKMHCKLKVSSENIEGQQIQICKEGKKYLSSLKCRVCNSLYSFDRVLTDTYYEQGIYKCKKCS